jgi:hypothetical protein
MPTAVVQLLHADPDLGEHMPPQAREQATELVRARVFRVPKGPWHPPDIDHGATGLLLLDGLMVRRLNANNACQPDRIWGLTYVMGDIRPRRMEAPLEPPAHMRYWRSAANRAPRDKQAPSFHPQCAVFRLATAGRG